MRGTSQASLQAAEGRFEPVLRDAGAQASTLGEQLFAVVDALDSSGSLRRTLADPSLDGDAKARLVAQLLSSADPRTVEAVDGLVRSRWSADADLTEAVEQLAFHAVLASAQATPGGLERVEEELFTIGRALAGQREVRRALFDDKIGARGRGAVVDQLLGGQGSPATEILARRAAVAPRGRRYVATLGHLSDLIADRRNREVATVTTATGLSEEQRARLSQILERAYGHPMQLNVIEDPHVIGGLRVQVGPEVMDATVLARLADARRRLAS
ncbi:F0F1 ATP synthase subunit delta [Cellulomonas sp. P22]|uniref:F0F1 ATP synthase subunit delta n=1 Tax=Cellulomonas sp. P22 TaxID=3373189 RepID=UPI0037B8883E